MPSSAIPISEYLASLPLRGGRNVFTFTSCFNYELITVGAPVCVCTRYTNRAICVATSVNSVSSAPPIVAPLTITCHVALHMSTKGDREQVFGGAPFRLS